MNSYIKDLASTDDLYLQVIRGTGTIKVATESGDTSLGEVGQLIIPASYTFTCGKAIKIKEIESVQIIDPVNDPNPQPVFSGQRQITSIVISEGIEKVDRSTIENHLYTAGQPPVDFCVRTSGESRISNFMLWQLAYAELYFPKVYWPGFTSKHLLASLLEYQGRDRRFGAIKE